MGDGWETARKPDRPAVLEVGADGLVKVRAQTVPFAGPGASRDAINPKSITRGVVGGMNAEINFSVEHKQN